MPCLRRIPPFGSTNISLITRPLPPPIRARAQASMSQGRASASPLMNKRRTVEIIDSMALVHERDRARRFDAREDGR